MIQIYKSNLGSALNQRDSTPRGHGECKEMFLFLSDAQGKNISFLEK